MSTASHISKLPPRVARPLSLGMLLLFLVLFAVGFARFGGYLQTALVMARCEAPQTTLQGTVTRTSLAKGYFWLWLDERKVFFDDAGSAAGQRPAVGDSVALTAQACRRVWLGQDLWQLDANGQRSRQLQWAQQLEDARNRLWQPLTGMAVFVLVGLWVIATFLVATVRAFSDGDPGTDTEV